MHIKYVGFLIKLDTFLITGPVIGDVTQTSAIIVIEDKCKGQKNPILRCQLFKKKDPSKPVQIQDLETTHGRPKSFVFKDLTPNTRYQAVFTSFLDTTVVASFKTKKSYEEMEKFKLLAISCDKPRRLLMGKLL